MVNRNRPASASASGMKRVTIVQRVLPHYRIPVFRRMREALLGDDIQLELAYGQEYPGTVPKTVALHEPWAFRVHNTYLKIPGMEMVWQPCLPQLRGSALIIVEQASRLLLNYLLLSRLAAKGAKIAYWGHGKNFQGTAGSLRERFKGLQVRRPDWWFTYTDAGTEIVAGAGFPRERITTVQNSIDTRELQDAKAQITAADLEAARRELGLGPHARACVYCGGMYPDKRIGFLLDACRLIREAIPDFHMIFIGDGPEQGQVEEAARQLSWIRYVGPRFGKERLSCFLLSRAQLMPGLVGLAIIDSFVTEVPLITTEIPWHSPEIAYLRHGANGLIAPDSTRAFAEAVTGYLRSASLQDQLRAGCRESAARYTIERMVGNFAGGIRACLREGK